MAPYGQPKGKDAKPQNEASEPKKGMSPTELKAMMRKMNGEAVATEARPPVSGLLPSGPRPGGPPNVRTR